jgi:hypothetical protein
VDDQQLLQLKLEKVKLMEEKLRLKAGLPHLYALKRYLWQKEYEEAKFYKKRLICAANQIGKSTIQIEDRLTIATTPELWKQLWPSQFEINPNLKPYSWYLYPNQDTVLTEFREKWEPMYLPRGEFKDHEIYGWKETITNKVLKYIEFNSGYKIYFKTYNQTAQDLQSGTVWAIDCDEELPEHLLPELQARLLATDGYFSMAFTATLGQDFWYKVIERKGEQDELWADAWKRQISMYDCLNYHDGTKAPWTTARIEQAVKNCKSPAEVNRRVKGRFVKDEGLLYSGFDRDRNYKPYPRLPNGKSFKGVPKGWSVYSSVDVGSGGEQGHPAAYSFLMVNPDYTKIRWFRGKRLDGIETTAEDIYKHYVRSSRGLDINVETYDWASKDFGTIANRAGRPFKKAEKNHELGEMALNTALKSGMLVIYYDPDDPHDESLKLVRELETLPVNANKRTAKDDFIDTVRYATVEIPIDWELVLNGEEATTVTKSPDSHNKREGINGFIWSNQKDEEEDQQSIEDEFAEWADLY